MSVRAGFIGLGNIGKPMAERLVAGGLETTVHDIAAAPVEDLVKLGAKSASSPRELASRCDIVGVCVRDDPDVLDVACGDNGLLAGAAPGTVIAIHSTVQPTTVEQVAAAAAEKDVGVLDACVSGGRIGAQQGTLTYMVGGDPKHLEKYRPALETSARKIVHTGALGTGVKVKLCNNLMTYLAWTAAFEATALARAVDLPQEMLDEVTRSTGNMTDPMRAFLGLHRAPEHVRRSESFQAMVRGHVMVAEKDLAWTLDLARRHGVSLPGTAACSQTMARVYGLEDTNRR